MGSKRPHTEVEASLSPHDASHKKRKQFKNNKPNNDGSNAPPGQSLNEVKKRARDIERRFAKGDELPADVQRNLERELAHCKRQIEDLQYKKKRSEMISKYHKVRFFERQKADRLRKQLKKRVDKATDSEEKAGLEQEQHIAEVDWYYTQYFPFMERYVGLYPAVKAEEDSGEGPIAKRALHAERPPMWKEIEEAIEKGQGALGRIQNRRPEKENVTPSEEGPSGARSEKVTTDKKSGKAKKETRKETKKETKKEPKSESTMHADRRRILYGKEEEERDPDADGTGFFA